MYTRKHRRCPVTPHNAYGPKFYLGGKVHHGFRTNCRSGSHHMVPWRRVSDVYHRLPAAKSLL